jgi:S-adenosylmethionine uptake transporter
MASDHSFRPFAAAIAAVALYSLMDALMKGASLAVGTYNALLLRSVCGFAFILPLWLASERRWPERDVLAVHIKRGVVGAGMAFTFFWGLTKLPLAEAIALSFFAPLIALFLAAILLGERIGRRAVGAALLGFAGVIVIALGQIGGPGGGDSALGVASVLASAVLYAWNLVLQRQQAQLASPIEVTTFQNAIVSLVLLALAPWLLELPGEARHWLWIAASAALGVSAAILFTWAYARAEAQVLVPLEYTAFLWAALFGWLLFDESVGPATLLGAALIVASCWIAAPRKRPEPSAA